MVGGTGQCVGIDYLVVRNRPFPQLPDEGRCHDVVGRQPLSTGPPALGDPTVPRFIILAHTLRLTIVVTALLLPVLTDHLGLTDQLAASRTARTIAAGGLARGLS